MNNVELNILEKTEEVRELSMTEIEGVAGALWHPAVIVAVAWYTAYVMYRQDQL